jgi:hypothetical protein
MQSPFTERSAYRHANNAAGSGATEKTLKDSFNLIILMVSQQQCVSPTELRLKNLVSRLARSSLRSLPQVVAHLNPMHREGHTTMIAQILTKAAPLSR